MPCPPWGFIFVVAYFKDREPHICWTASALICITSLPALEEKSPVFGVNSTRRNKGDLQMKLTHTIIAISLVTLTAFAQDVRYNFAANADFTKYRTYRWGMIKGADQPDQITDQQIKSAIDAELAKKGMMKTDADTSDLIIGYQVSIGSEKQITMYDSGWGYGAGWGRGWYGYGAGGGGMTTGTTSTIAVGQLDLDIYDAKEKNLVWRGNATKTLDSTAKPEKRLKNLQKGAAKLLKNFPPKKKS
jgi:Domain of unknown function (DUF4136)